MSDTEESERDQLAWSAMVADDVRQVHEEQLSPSEVLLERYDIDPDDYGTEEALVSAVRSARQEGEWD